MLNNRKSNLSQYEFEQTEKKLEKNCNKALFSEKMKVKKQKSLGYRIEAMVTKNQEKV